MFTRTSLDALGELRALAYPHVSRLGRESHTLVEKSTFSGDSYGSSDPTLPINDLWDRAERLKRAIDAAFPPDNA